MNRLLILFLFFALVSCKNDKAAVNESKKLLGQDYATELLEKVITGKQFNALNEITIIPDKETAIKIAEKILFKVYGKENIEEQKPYEIYLIDGYWIMFGTLHYGVGGTFLIVMDSKNGEVINIGHGK